MQEVDEDDEEANKEATVQTVIRVKKEPVPLPVSTKPITYKFQETAQNCFVVISLPKYRKEDVVVVVHNQKVN